MAAVTPLHVALVQFSPSDPALHPAAASDNLSRAHQFVRDAKKGGANLVVFPEYFISGIISDPAHRHVAQREHSPSVVKSHTVDSPHWLESFRLLAIEQEIDIVVGSIVEKNEEGDVLSNVAHYVDWQGVVLGRYKKINLWHPEKEYLTPSPDGNQVFETRFGRVGMMICWDLAFPESFRPLLLSRADIIICPTFWTATDGDPVGLSHNPDSEILYLESTITARAFENECVVVFVNAGGEKEAGYIGGSRVAVPFKGVIGGAKGGEEEMVLVKVDIGILEDARKVYGIRKDLVAKMLREGKSLPEGVEP